MALVLVLLGLALSCGNNTAGHIGVVWCRRTVAVRCAHYLRWTKYLCQNIALAQVMHLSHDVRLLLLPTPRRRCCWSIGLVCAFVCHLVPALLLHIG